MLMNVTEKLTNNETRKHIIQVIEYLSVMQIELCNRIVQHDKTKLSSPEVELFTEFTPKLSGTTYGSEEYKEYLNQLRPALDHHYKHNSHHPEHYENGIDGMTLIDLVEMICDWKAATLRHADGDMTKSIEHNKKRYGISDQLTQILFNTNKLLEEKDVGNS